MEAYFQFICFVMCMLVPLLVFSVTKKAIPGLKRGKPDKLPGDKVSKLKDECDFRTVKEEDIRLIRSRIRESIMIPAFATVICVIAVAGLVSLYRQGRVPLSYTLMGVLAITAMCLICFWLGIKKGAVFHKHDNFQITQGLILKDKKRYIKLPRTAARIEVHDLVVAFYNMDRELMIVKDTAPKNVMLWVEKTGYCRVVLFHGYAATII